MKALLHLKQHHRASRVLGVGQGEVDSKGAGGFRHLLRPAMQTVLHDAAQPSHIVLPIIPR